MPCSATGPTSRTCATRSSSPTLPRSSAAPASASSRARSSRAPWCGRSRRRARPRSFFDKLNDWAKEQGAAGLGYIGFAADGAKGPIAKNLDEARLAQIRQTAGLKDGDAVFFACDKKAGAE